MRAQLNGKTSSTQPRTTTLAGRRIQGGRASAGEQMQRRKDKSLTAIQKQKAKTRENKEANPQLPRKQKAKVSLAHFKVPSTCLELQRKARNQKR